MGLMAAGAEGLLAEVRGSAFRALCRATGLDADGLAVVARKARKLGIISPRTAKKLVRIDEAFSLVRHLSGPRADRFDAALRAELLAHTGEAEHVKHEEETAESTNEGNIQNLPVTDTQEEGAGEKLGEEAHISTDILETGTLPKSPDPGTATSSMEEASPGLVIGNEKPITVDADAVPVEDISNDNSKRLAVIERRAQETPDLAMAVATSALDKAAAAGRECTPDDMLAEMRNIGVGMTSESDARIFANDVAKALLTIAAQRRLSAG